MNPINPFEPNTEPDPRRFAGSIVSDQNTTIGEWEAFLCNTKNDLSEHLHLDVLGLVSRIPKTELLWPIAYLKSICVDKSFRNRGYGSEGLHHFREEAIQKGARVALVRIGWNSESPMAKNLNFYKKASWDFLFQMNECGVPQSAPFAALRLHAGSTSRPFS